MGRLRKIKDDVEKVKTSPYYFNGVFSNKLPNQIEIGMGKRAFLIAKASQNKNINFYGIDKFATVILKACNKLNKIKPLSNLKFLSIDVEHILEYFPENYFDVIYLNFSDPWPKKHHEKRRLTSQRFLDLYSKLLKKNGIVEFKTDNDKFYLYSLETLKNIKGIKIIEYYDDFYKSHKISDYIQTEYEKKFISQHVKIKYIKWTFTQDYKLSFASKITKR